MSSSYALDHARPAALAQLAAELIADHAEEVGPGEFNFATEAAKNAYAELLEAGGRLVRAEYFWTLIEEALAREFKTAGALAADDLPF